jgi:hypothetical protein
MSNVWGVFSLDRHKVLENEFVSVVRCKKGKQSYLVCPVKNSLYQ